MKREWMVAACVVTGAAGLYVGRSAHAEPPKVSCETLYYEFEDGKRASRANVDTLRDTIYGAITAKMVAGYVRPVYSSTFPLVNSLNGSMVGQAGVLCFATAGN